MSIRTCPSHVLHKLCVYDSWIKYGWSIFSDLGIVTHYNFGIGFSFLMSSFFLKFSSFSSLSRYSRSTISSFISWSCFTAVWQLIFISIKWISYWWFSSLIFFMFYKVTFSLSKLTLIFIWSSLFCLYSLILSSLLIRYFSLLSKFYQICFVEFSSCP